MCGDASPAIAEPPGLIAGGAHWKIMGCDGPGQRGSQCNTRHVWWGGGEGSLYVTDLNDQVRNKDLGFLFGFTA